MSINTKSTASKNGTSTTTPEPKTIGERIRVLRKKRGLKQRVLADRVASNKSTVSRWETGKRIPDVDMINALADVFGVSPKYLMFGQNKENDADYLDLRGLTYYQIDLIKKLVEEFRKGC